jgi:hypothetical protein
VGRLEVLEPLGNLALMHVALPAAPTLGSVRVLGPLDPGFREGDAMGLTFRPERLHFFDPNSGSRISEPKG